MTPLTGCQSGYEDGTTLQNSDNTVISRRKRHLDAKLSTPGAIGEKSREVAETAEFEVNNEEEATIPETRELIDGSKEPLKSYPKRIAIFTKATNLKGYGFKQYFKLSLIHI